MVFLDDVVTVEIERTTFCQDYKLPIIIGFDQDKFLVRLLELGHDYFNINRVYALLFDITPVNKIKIDMKNYKEVVDQFPNDRLYPYAFYIGNYKEEDHMHIVNQLMEINKHTIIEVIK